MSNKVDKFTQAYIECALWSSTDNANEQGGEPLDENYDVSDITPETLAKMIEDCRAFQEANRQALDDCGLSLERQGHDYWLTRNHHGAGFWDEGYRASSEANKALDELTKASHADGSFDLYVSDGRIHGG